MSGETQNRSTFGGGKIDLFQGGEAIAELFGERCFPKIFR